MWMKGTRATRMSGTVFHKHKYISSPSMTPEDAVLAAARKSAETLKGHMPQHLQELSLDELKQLGTIFQQAASIDPVEHIDLP